MSDFVGWVERPSLLRRLFYYYLPIWTFGFVRETYLILTDLWYMPGLLSRYVTAFRGGYGGFPNNCGCTHCTPLLNGLPRGFDTIIWVMAIWALRGGGEWKGWVKSPRGFFADPLVKRLEKSLDLDWSYLSDNDVDGEDSYF